MSRYIDADLIEYKEIFVPSLYGKSVRTGKLDGLYANREDIEGLSTADVQEVKHGRWLRTVPTSTWSYRRVCSLCGQTANMIRARYAYCPWCGAKMDGGESE